MATDSEMPQGYWINRNDDPEKTIEMDRRALATMAETAPSRFVAHGVGSYDEAIHAQCLELGKADSIEEGWDMTWLETLCGVNLNDIAPQIIGSCVATSHIVLLATRALHEVVLLGRADELLGKDLSGRKSIAPFGPYSYRAGRKYAGISGRGDGSTCAGQIRGTMTYGFLPCDTPSLESDFFPEPKSTSLYRAWGANDSYLEKFADFGKSLDLVEAPEVRTVEQASELLQQFKPLQICSGWGFRPTGKRLPNGDILHSRSGSWAHSMQVQAICKMSDGNWYVKIRNQWGRTYHSGKPYFWVTIEEFAKWLRNSSTLAIGSLQNRASRAIDVFGG